MVYVENSLDTSLKPAETSDDRMSCFKLVSRERLDSTYAAIAKKRYFSTCNKLYLLMMKLITDAELFPTQLVAKTLAVYLTL